jgi:hypothetical protein
LGEEIPHDNSIVRTSACDQSAGHIIARADEEGDDFQTAKPAKSHYRFWDGTLLIVGTLLVAAGWEIFRWILAIITLH